ncbi:hypothetical protein NDN08_001240 [Rhodosorus marinus]|uniref:Pyruvate kinase n=1 Tax=Rhodosorus marinus TaxID=101924 RepID=A0AAV8UUD0_9RHOD|nr:hypothetical protein NDN08_001240 [Rhodosorus marinus]
MSVRSWVRFGSVATGTGRAVWSYGSKRSMSSMMNLGNLVRSQTVAREEGLLPSTKIVCTIGPVSESEVMIPRMVQSGMTCMRINCSHATFEEQKNRIQRLQKAVSHNGVEQAVVPVPVLLDIKGPSIRTGFLEGPLKGKNKVQLEKGKPITIRTDVVYDSYKGHSGEISVSYPKLHDELTINDVVLVDDGVIELVVKSISTGKVECEVIEGGILGEKKGLNLPGVATGVEFMTEKDKMDLDHGVGELGVDFVAASFVRGPDVIRAFRKYLNENCGPHGKEVGIVAKIENEEGLINYDEILDEVEGIMVARGDLGVEIPTEKLFLMQKLMIQRANEAGKFVINCTQMLDSMMDNPRPTRAEALDVANAVLDGADATMLSGESAGGRFPEKSVATMREIVTEADDAFSRQTVPAPAAGRKGVLALRSSTAKMALECAVSNKASLFIILPQSLEEIEETYDIAHELARARPWAPISGPIKIVVIGGFGTDFEAGKSHGREPGTTFRQLAIRSNCFPLRPSSGDFEKLSAGEAMDMVKEAKLLSSKPGHVACIVHPRQKPYIFVPGSRNH